MILLTGTLMAMVYLGITYLSRGIPYLAMPENVTADVVDQMTALIQTYAVYLAAVLSGVLMLGGILLWLVLRRVARRALIFTGQKKSTAGQKATADVQKKDDSQTLHSQRLYLHILSVLQREGRLVDFFEEDLGRYADEQVGAAVRNIHGTCQKVLDRRLALLPIVSKNEGETIEVEAGFDPDAIKLTGRVTGQPPFKGVIRHRGWRVKKVDLPDLTALKDPMIISPAEVEIE
jgi:hypothetical protein